MDNKNNRYVIVFSIETGKLNTERKHRISYNTSIQTSYDYSNSSQEISELINTYNSIYKNEPEPVKVDSYYEHKITHKQVRYVGYRENEEDYTYHNEYIDYSDGKKLWCWILLDFEECKIIRTGGKSKLLKQLYGENIKSSLRLKDRFFRKDDEIPKGYRFDIGEYEGWLQYRWGDGKNSLTYIEPAKPKNTSKNITKTPEEASDEDLQKYLVNYSSDDNDCPEVDLDEEYYNKFYSE